MKAYDKKRGDIHLFSSFLSFICEDIPRDLCASAIYFIVLTLALEPGAGVG